MFSPLWPIFVLPKPTLDTDRWVTAPVGRGTLAVKATGRLFVKPAGKEDPSTWAVLKPDRLIYAPLGEKGKSFFLPWTDWS